MRRSACCFSLLVLALLLLLGGGAGVVKGVGSPAQTLNLPEGEAGAVVDDESVPEVTARVARISFINGDAKVRRAGVEEWENATLNLSIVEGDEIVTETGGRVEIQFDKYQHLRLAESSYLKVVTLRDEGIAASLSVGTLSLRITSFNKERTYFEIDAPKTTLAVQRAGAYRVDAGKEGDAEVRISATEGGEARVYSDNAGFTLKNGRSARVFIEGPNVGEWETASASLNTDDFDSWVGDRDAYVAKQLKDSYYDRYYDDDIYGADDLNDNGEWVHTRNYGYVWRPYRTSLSRYADWSPYRYGHWRWMRPYGWIWVNDEPWGWATYHHGRWFYDAGSWYWSPYGYYRSARSWWFPALVVINIFNNNVCWYPLPYHRPYNNYNGHHNNGPRPVHHPTTGPTRPIRVTGDGATIRPNPQGPTASTGKPLPTRGDETSIIPTSGVVSTTKDEFGTIAKGTRRPPLAVATAVIAQAADPVRVPALPSYQDVTRKMTRDIRTATPSIASSDAPVRTGAGTRKTTAPLDDELRTTKVFGGRPPLTNVPETGGTRTTPTTTPETRKTGAVERPPVVVRQDNDPPVRQAPAYTPPVKTRDESQNDPVRVPRYDPPPRDEAPPVRQQPPPRYDPPPVRQQPPPTKSDPPPTKSEPKPESKPTRSPDSVVDSKKKDG